MIFQSMESSNFPSTWKNQLQLQASFYIIYIISFIYLLAVLGLCCCASFSLVVAFGSCFLVAVDRLLTAVACLAADHGHQGAWALVVGMWAQQLWLPGLEHRFNSCGTQAQLLFGMWNLPGPGTERMTPALAGRFFITEPPGKPLQAGLISISLLPSGYVTSGQYLNLSEF